MRKIFAVFTFLLLTSLPTFVTPFSASTTTIFSDTFSPQQPGWSFQSPSPGVLGELNNNVNVANVTLTIDVPNAVSDASLEFDLLAIRTLDGISCCTDTLTLTINGAVAFTAAFHGLIPERSTFFTNPAGATFSTPDGGFHYHVVVPTHLLAGTNTFNWSYTPLQSFDDEAWGLDNVLINSSSANREFTVNFTTFIPGNSIDGPPNLRCGLSNPGRIFNLVFAGDDRTFSPVANSFRTRQLVTVIPEESVDLDGLKEGSINNLTGKTRAYAADALPTIDSADDDPILQDCHLLHAIGQADNANMHITVTRIGSQQVSVRLYGGAGNPLVNTAPHIDSIDWDFTITIDTSGPNPHWTLTGTDDGFPAFEIYINDIPIYTRNAPPPYTFQRDLLKLLPRRGDVMVNLSGELL